MHKAITYSDEVKPIMMKKENHKYILLDGEYAERTVEIEINGI